MSLDQEKQIAAKEAVKYIKSGMTVGWGTGSTAAHMVNELGKLVLNGLKIVGVPSSESTKKLATEKGIPLITLENASSIDVYIDGADETNRHLHLVKGGGGALTREKIVAAASKKFVCIADDSKLVDVLGKFPLPIEVIRRAQIGIASGRERV